MVKCEHAKLYSKMLKIELEWQRSLSSVSLSHTHAHSISLSSFHTFDVSLLSTGSKITSQSWHEPSHVVSISCSGRPFVRPNLNLAKNFVTKFSLFANSVRRVLCSANARLPTTLDIDGGLFLSLCFYDCILQLLSNFTHLYSSFSSPPPRRRRLLWSHLRSHIL